MAIQDAEVMAMFVEESREHLDCFEASLLALEEHKNEPEQVNELVNRIFRAVHSVKGGAGFFGLTAINKLSHTMETVMTPVRDGKCRPDKDMIDILLAGGDKLRAMIDDIEHSNDFDITEVLRRMEALARGEAGGAKLAGAPAPSAIMDKAVDVSHVPDPLGRFDVGDDVLREAEERGRFLYVVKVFTIKDLAARNKAPVDYVKKLESLGALIDSRLDVSAVTGLDTCLDADIPFHFLFSSVLEPDLVKVGLDIPEEQITQVSADELRKARSNASAAAASAPDIRPHHGDESPEVHHMDDKADETEIALPSRIGKKQLVASYESEVALVPAGAAAQLPAKQTSPVKKEESIRVPVNVLDGLMTLAGEMVLGRNRLLRMTEDIARQVHGLPAALQSINLVTSELQEKVMRTRMQPLDVVFSKFNRVVRDLSRKLGKEIEIELQGQDVELDKSLIEMLSDPITHLVRNCADHGIEPPDERERLGKPRSGKVQLLARHEGGQVHIVIVDDGRGMDARKLKRKAIDKGMLTPAAAEAMTEQDAYSIIFLPGFSTVENISDVSGRGVGMDVVKANIEQFGGSVDVESELGKGARITLHLPLTLAIIPSLVVMVGDSRFAVPQVNLEEVVLLNENTRIEKVYEAGVMRLRGKLLPLVDLHALLNIPASTKRDSSYVLVVKARQHHFGLVVDNLMDSEEIVVKPLSSYLKKCKCYSGCAILGDGNLAMILDTPGIADLAGLRFSEIAAANLAIQRKENHAGYGQDAQSLLLFRSGPSELFGIHLELVTRIERARKSNVERIADRMFLKRDGGSLRTLLLHDYLPVSKPELESDFFYVVVPKLLRNPMGIFATSVVDIIKTDARLDRESITTPGILGTAVVNNDLIVVIDIYGLLEKAEPGLHGWRKEDAYLTGKRVLLAEDTEFFRSIEAEYLVAFGCVVDVVPDGNAAWERLRTTTYDLVLTDVEMPGMNGFELTRRIRSTEHLRKLPVVALTALSGKEFEKKGRDAGVDAYETKLDRDRLRLTLEQVVRRKITISQA